MAVVVPLAEELYFRGLLLEHLRRGFGPIAAVVLCSLLLALLHMPAGTMFGAAVLSLLACVVTLRIANVTFNLTNRCRLRCAWCYNPRMATAELPLARLFDWLRAGAAALEPDTAFLILGGEPFLDQARLAECVGRARECFAAEVGDRPADAHPATACP